MGAPAIDPAVAQKVMINAGVTPLVPFSKNREPWKSKCQTCKRIVSPSYANVRNGHAACRYCTKGGVSEVEARRILLKSMVTPTVPYPGFKKPWSSKCQVCGKSISPRVSLVQKTGKACNYCNRRKVDPKDALAVAMKSGVIPLVDYPGPGKWKSKCKQCKRIIYPTLRRMRNGQNPCGWCARVRIDPSEAKEAFLAVGLKPIGKYPGIAEPWPAICLNCGERVERPLSRIQAGRYACGFCSGRKIKETKAKAIMKDAGAIPLEPFVGINEKWLCKCSICLRQIEPKFANVRSGHSPCVYCSGKRVDPNTAYEFAISRALKPLRKYPGASKPWKVLCLKCQRTSTVSWVSIQMRRKNAGCSSCTVHGFKPLDPAYLYLISHPGKKAHKVGIGNKNARRIEHHVRNGWQIYKVLEYSKGLHAHKIEQSLIEWLRVEKSIGPAFRTGDGWTETVPSGEISLIAISRKMSEFDKSKGKVVNNEIFKR